MVTKRIMVLEQAINVVNCFTGLKSTLSLTELDSMLDIPKSSLHRILVSLTHKDVLMHDKERQQYTLGKTFRGWSATMFHRLRLDDIAHPFLESFRNQSGETATLSMRVGLMRTYVFMFESSSEVRMSVELGKMLPLHAGANGKVILAQMSPNEVEQTISEIGLYSITPSTITNREKLLDELKKIKEEGFAISAGERVQEAMTVAAPLFSRDGELIGSIGLHGPASRFTMDMAREWGIILCRAAEEISRNVAWSKP
ncbi:IclR family transcriptional regulator [Desulfosporosinus burensis]